MFGDHLDVYDIKQSVNDGATVPIYYESRLIKVHLREEQKTELDRKAALVADAHGFPTKESPMLVQEETIVGSKERLQEVAKDVIVHFEARQEVFEGKGLVVTMSRRIAVELYAEIVKLRPAWHHTDKTDGAIKIVMTSSSSDPESWQMHSTTKQERKELGDRLKDPDDLLRLVIVCDMWLTGFDAPCLHTMYIDKPIRGHNLMQAIARVNRVYKDKPGGLVVDYIGMASDLERALVTYTESGGAGSPTLNQADAIAAMQEKHEVVAQMFTGFCYKQYFSADTKEKLQLILEAQEHVLGLEDGKNRFVKEVGLLSKAFALAVPSDEAMRIKDEVGFFQAVKARLVKFERGENGKSDAETETAIRQIIDQAIVADGVVDIFDAAGIKKPDIALLSDEFLEQVRSMERKNIALELLKKILADEIKTRTKKNLIQSKKLSEMLEDAIRKYQNNLLTAAQIIDELISIAREVKAADRRGQDLGLTEDEIAFYDALADNESAREVLGDATLCKLARILIEKVKTNATIDWTIKESVQAKLRVIVKKTLREYGYPPDEQKLATDNILKQAELFAGEWGAVS